MLIVFNRHIRARDVALVLVTTVLSLQSARNIELFVAASTAVYIDQLDLATPRLRAASAPPSARAGQARECGPRATTAAVSRIRASATARRWTRRRRTSRGWSRRWQLQPYSLAYAQEYPVCAAQWLAGAPDGLKIFNQYGEGGYLAYTLSSHDDKVFIFGDAALMGDQML